MRRAIFTLCLLLAIALPCQAKGEKPKPNTLTAKEIADGWILLFDGETTFGWSAGGFGPGAKVSAEKGQLEFGNRGFAQFSTVFGSCEIEFECKCTEMKARGKLVLHGGPEFKSGVGVSFDAPPNNWTRVAVRVSDGKMLTDLPGGKVTRDWPIGASAKLELGLNDEGSFQVRNLKLRPLNTKSLFNGKDLDGWNVFPKRKSQFAVIDGAINVKDGPGDLQTVGKYQDFVLQLECISNGKHLNSGIFFRCKDNEYQNGYEAQIFNKFTDKATQKYQIEEYDPKTNKLIGKKEAMFTAVDFGTGAIYRRVPARKEMSKDGEWFGMTIAAHGNHFATWVNGVQVTDWTDNRPKSDNPRSGCRLEGGHISIQGHDPTTNLSFKNLRIAELPNAK